VAGDDLVAPLLVSLEHLIARQLVASSTDEVHDEQPKGLHQPNLAEVNGLCQFSLLRKNITMSMTHYNKTSNCNVNDCPVTVLPPDD
jgi:hypothetical protein